MTAPSACPSFLALDDEATFLIDCGKTKGHPDMHRAANGREWTDAEGRQR
jgi:hypothetical protein